MNKLIKTEEEYDQAIIRHSVLNDKNINGIIKPEELEEYDLLAVLMEKYEKQFPLDVKVIPKSCPWKNTLHANKEDKFEIQLDRKRGHYVVCMNCFVSGPYGISPREAIEKWNER